MKKSEIFLVTLSLFVLVGLSMAICTEVAQAQTKTLKIGLLSSVTGPLAPAFKANVEGAKPTADLLNQRGRVTVKGQKYNIEIVTEDDQSSPPGAVAGMNKLLQEGVRFVIPPMFMPCDLAIAPIAEQAKILRVKAYGAGNAELNPNTPFYFYAYTDTIFGQVKMGGQEIFGINHAMLRPVAMSRIMKDKVETEIIPNKNYQVMCK
jgi:hypothetical protein